jgi:hypothetical protein
MKPAMTGQQADALAAFLVTLRVGQGRWTKAAIYDALTAAAAKFTPDAETLTRAAVRAALTPSIVSPEVIAMPGAHWESVSHTPAHEGIKARLCVECHTIHTADCPCASRPSERRASYLAQMREVARNAKRPPDMTVERARTYAEQLPEES